VENLEFIRRPRSNRLWTPDGLWCADVAHITPLDRHFLCCCQRLRSPHQPTSGIAITGTRASCPAISSRPTTTFRSMARGERSAAQPAIRRATGMVARYYFGNPGFLSRPLHGCSFGPCWTITCIGRVWNPPGPGSRATREPPEGGFPSLGSAPEGRSILYFTFRDPPILQPPYITLQAINSPNLQRSIGVCKQRVSSIGLWQRAFTGALFQEPTVTSIG
jgi:hypothetical protein